MFRHRSDEPRTCNGEHGRILTVLLLILGALLVLVVVVLDSLQGSILGLLLPFATQPPVGEVFPPPNPAHVAVLELSASERAETLRQAVTAPSSPCEEVMRTSMAYKDASGALYWNIVCRGGVVYAVGVANDPTGSRTARPCGSLPDRELSAEELLRFCFADRVR